MSKSTDLKSILKDPSLLETRAYINGAWVDGDDGTFDVLNPARGDVVAKVANLSRAQVADAIRHAEKAQKEWAKWTGKEPSINSSRSPLVEDIPNKSVTTPIFK